MIRWIEIGALDAIFRVLARASCARPPETSRYSGPTNDDVFALDDRCPHKGGPLSQGIVHNRRVTCPLHNFVIELANGQAVAPDQGCTRSHPAKVEERSRVAVDPPGRDCRLSAGRSGTPVRAHPEPSV